MATVLIGEVNADVRAAYSLLLRRAGYTVSAAADPTGVIEAAVREQPDLVILNLRDEDGPDTCRALRADPSTADAPILMLSADLYPDADAAAAAGADTYPPKPVHNDVFLHHAHALLHAGNACTARSPLSCPSEFAGSSQHRQVDERALR